jgi:hypothetical protein
MINGKTVGLGILSYKAHETLKKTLASLEQKNVRSFFDDSVIYFNDFCEQDKEIADAFSYRAVGGPNIGFTAQQQLAEHIDADYIVLIQNDCPLIEPCSELEKQLTTAVELIEAGQIDLMRLRHQWRVGEGFCDVEKYARFYNINAVNEAFIAREHGLDEKKLNPTRMKYFKRYFRPLKARRLIGRSVYVEKFPEKCFPKYIQRTGDVLIVDSECIDYTEQSFLIQKEFFLNTLCRFINENPKKRTLNGFQVPEIILNCLWWRKKHFKIGVCKGLFTHNRFDDSFRKNHRYYNKKI